MADLARIKNNVRKMVSQGAPEADIDGYIASEGVTVDDVRAFKTNQHPEFDASNITGYNPKTGMVDKYGKAGSAAMGAADIWGMGFGDEIAAGAGYLLDKLPGRGGKDYSTILGEIRGNQNEAYEANPGSYIAGQVGGGVTSAAALAKSGLSLGANALSRGAPLGRVALGGAADGAMLGGIHGAGSGTDLKSRAAGAITGGVGGGVTGAVAPYAVAGASAAIKPVVAPIMARLRPQGYTDAALGEGLRRAGMTADDVANVLARSQADDQGMFTVADAMGNSGQRMLSTATRNPHEGRQAVVDALQQRQMGQGERLSRFLAEGFDAPDTAAQRAARLTTERTNAANVNYANARNGAGHVDVSGALSDIDDVLRPGVNRIANPGSNIADDSLEGVVRRAQRLLTDGKSNLTDFSSVLRAKQDIQDMIGAAQRQGRNNQVRLLSQINTKLDEALEKASPGYRTANDTFRQQSRVIDAVETGRGATSMRTRSTDNIAEFNRLSPAEQKAFRAGYADPMIARVESMSMSPATNKARPLITPKTGEEFPAFAHPGRADQMGTRIAREQRMFETANHALGGSKTADNLADAAEMAKFDPGVMAKLLQGRPVAAIIDAVTRLVNEGNGLPPRVLTQVARALMETDPQAARAVLSAASRVTQRSAARSALANSMLTQAGASASGRLTAP